MHNTIASERKRLGMSQTDLGRLINRDRSAVSRIETSAAPLDADTIIQLTEIFKCSADYLLGLTDERVPAGMRR